jgi:hypothetical protein
MRILNFFFDGNEMGVEEGKECARIMLQKVGMKDRRKKVQSAIFGVKNRR